MLFSDTFTYANGNLNGQGGWTKRPGGAFSSSLVVSNTAQPSGILICSNRHTLPSVLSASSWSMAFTATMPPPTAQQILDFGFQNIGTGENMYAEVNRDTSNFADLYWVDNAGVLWEVDGVPFADNAPHTIVVTWSTPTLTIWLDGVVQLVVNSPAVTPTPGTLIFVEQCLGVGEVFSADDIVIRSL